MTEPELSPSSPPVTEATVRIVSARPGSEPGAAMLRAYFAEIVVRYHVRHDLGATADGDVDRALAEEPSEDLQPPSGRFWVATLDDRPVGCVGLRLLPTGIAELTRMFVRSTARRRGVGARLLHEAEVAAVEAGCLQVRLDTRHDLVEARALYAREGYAEVPAFSDGPYAERWMAKRLG